MATAQLNPVLTSISGSVGRLVFYSRFGKTIMRAWIIPPNPRTPAQQANRSRFRDAMLSWRQLPDEEKDSFNRKGKKLGMTGHNLYISRYMKGTAGAERVQTATAPAYRGTRSATPNLALSKLPHSCPCFALREKEAGRMRAFTLHNLYRSVNAPSARACRVYAQPITDNLPSGA